jgi:hypothetical protein
MYDEALRELEKKLQKLRAAGRGQSFTAHQLRVLLIQVRDAMLRMGPPVAGALAGVSRVAQTAAVRALVSDVARLSSLYTGAEIALPLDEVALLRGITDPLRPTLLRMHEASVARYGSAVVTEVGKKLGTVLATGGSTDEAIEAVQDVTHTMWWQAERIARTEVAYAFNATHAAANREASREVEGLRSRWSEHVSDITGAPLDNRVAADSIALHGQVESGGIFTMPESENVSAVLWGKRYTHPPNRPNDRAVLSPWMPRWGIPGWELRNGERVALS